MELVYILVIGAVAGWLANLFIGGNGGGLIWNIILGIIGSFVGGWLLGKMGVSVRLGSQIINLLVTSTIGAAVLLFIGRLIQRR